MSFTDNSEDEFGFEIRRDAVDPAGNCDAGAVVATAPSNAGTGNVIYSDNTAAPSSTYWYWAKAFNGAGDNGSCTDAASATTLAAPAISLDSANGYKIKGRQNVDLTWSGATGTDVDINRDGAVIDTTANGGSYTDNIGVKGGGSYTYKICEAGSSTACTPTANVVF